MRLAFLHTSAAHVETFGRLVAALAPEVRVDHHVDETLLDEARGTGPNDEALNAHVRAAMTTAAAGGATLVVCTCSTIGAAAESMPPDSFGVARIDRAMADRAVERGSRVLVVAALADTLAPTTALIRDSARRRNTVAVIDTLVVPAAWPLFKAGDLAGYAEIIAAAVREAVRAAGRVDAPDVVVLAQASMAQTAALLSDLDIDVLASPELGVRAALRALIVPVAPVVHQGAVSRGAG